MVDEYYSSQEIDRIIYVWARYSGKRDSSPEGKSYFKHDFIELFRRINKYKDNPKSFQDGFEIEDKEDE